MNYFVSFITGIIFGLIPTAYLIIKKFENKNILKSGSGNMGAMNTYRVSNSKLLAFLVFIIDFLKGMIPVIILTNIGFNIIEISVAVVTVIFFHCYNFLLNLKGGKGLATAFGSTITVFPAVPLLWLIFWLVSFVYKRNINFANIIASVLTVSISIYNRELMNTYNFYRFENSWNFSLVTGIIFIIILSKHYNELKSLINIKKNDYE